MIDTISIVLPYTPSPLPLTTPSHPTTQLAYRSDPWKRGENKQNYTMETQHNELEPTVQ
jgi:hypothetical protein